VSVAGLILAAGESRRMGFPKAMLRYREETFLDTLIGLFAPYCSPIVVVLGAHADRIRESTLRTAMFVVNEDYQRGMTTSLQCGLRTLPPQVDSVLFTLVDHPAVSTATIKSLLAAPWPQLRVPRHGGRRGHPIWFSRELIPEFLAIPETGAARDVVRAHSADTQFLDVDDPGILADIDDPVEYGRLTGAPL
jgi:CTP:molybdopterin cytidylyltransferase MocA